MLETVVLLPLRKVQETNRKKSDMRNYFRKVGPKHVSCQSCSKQMAYHGGTANLRDHLIRIHPTSASTSLNSFLSKSKCPPSRSRHITARNLRPAAIIKDEGFMHF